MRLGGTSLRVLCLAVSAGSALSLCALLATGCGLTSTVDPGTFEGVRDLKLDENYYYCVVQPFVITAQRCSSGGAGDPSGGCHSSKSSMILADIATPVACSGTKPTGIISQPERSNYQATQLRVTRDPESSPLLARPTGRQSHPRVIFDINDKTPCAPGTTLSCANILRAWIQGGR